MIVENQENRWKLPALDSRSAQFAIASLLKFPQGFSQI